MVEDLVTNVEEEPMEEAFTFLEVCTELSSQLVQSITDDRATVDKRGI